MTGRALHVHLDGTLCGAVEQAASGNLTFEYDPAYRAAPGATPLSLSMPLAAGRHHKRAVLPYLQGLLPDNSEALRAMARRYSVSGANPFALLEHVGADVAGAAQILPPQQESSDATQPRTTVRPVSEAEVATMLDHVVAEYEDGTPFAGPAGRFSLDRISAADLAAVGRQFGVGAAAGEIVEEMRASVVEAFEDAGEALRTRGNGAKRVPGEASAGPRRLPLVRDRTGAATAPRQDTSYADVMPARPRWRAFTS